MYEFVRHVFTYYEEHGRHTLPWRETSDPYHILISEIMLQQTQAERVIPKYNAFVLRFPTVHSLAAASLSDVYALWSGLGYNRRARFLRDAAKIIVAKHNGSIPGSLDEMMRLPGIGEYTATAVLVFSKRLQASVIETNVRTVIIAHFFRSKTAITDAEVRAVLDTCTPYIHDWYIWNAALMDYGAYLKKSYKNFSKQSSQYYKQTPFKGSIRSIRCEIMRHVSKVKCAVEKDIRNSLTCSDTSFSKAIDSLVRDNLIKRRLVGKRHIVMLAQ